MSFQDLHLKHSYTSEKDDLLSDFYIPVLREAVSYKRITGYFSSSSFFIAARGYSEIIRNKGQFQFIFNVHLSEMDYEQIEQGLSTPEKIIENKIFHDLNSLENTCIKYYSQILGWLIANKQMEIKIAYIEKRQQGNEIFHQKSGILQDNDGNIITFVGSNNESAYGWLHNSEKFKVFLSWEDIYKESMHDDISEFEELWNNKTKKTRVIPFPDAVRQHLVNIRPEGSYEFDRILNEIEKGGEEQSVFDSSGMQQSRNLVTLRQYQLDAVEEWFKNGCSGLFEMATGTGKTLAALAALKRLLKNEKRLITIICCPFLHLDKQWEDTIHQMNITTPILYASSIDTKWKDKLIEKILDNRLGKLDQFIVLTTHDTISSEKFIQVIEDAKSPICLIADEVHGMGSIERVNGLLEKYKFRLGLSATPHRYFDERGTEQLMDYFGKTVYEFNLHRAINEINPATNESYLVPYDYHLFFAELNSDEMDLYSELSRQIAILYSKKKRTKEDELYLEKKLRDRQDILKDALAKYPVFIELLSQLKRGDEIAHTLVYCSPKQIKKAQEIISEIGGIFQHKFTSGEDATKMQSKFNNKTEREYLLDNFDNGNYSVLVAIKCLDEGVDVPSTRNAILMCSSGNPKEYIQRRGRVLRRFPGKEKAVIYDITAIPNFHDARLNPEIEQKIFNSQLKRLTEFAKDAKNESEVLRKILELKKKYGVM